MKILLDTHFVIELIDGVQDGQSETGVLERAQEEGDFVVSTVSLWEADIKSRLGKLPLVHGVRAWPGLLAAANIELLALTGEQILADIGPEPENRDPFDRALLCVAAAENGKLLTEDKILARHPIAWRSFPM